MFFRRCHPISSVTTPYYRKMSHGLVGHVNTLDVENEIAFKTKMKQGMHLRSHLAEKRMLDIIPAKFFCWADLQTCVNKSVTWLKQFKHPDGEASFAFQTGIVSIEMQSKRRVVL